LTYNLTFGRNSQLIWAMILPSFILLVPLLLFLTYVMPYLPDSAWTVIVVSMIYLGLAILLTLRWVKLITAPVIIVIENENISFTFPKKNIFHRYDFSLTINEIINLGQDTDKGFDFLYFETSHKHFHKFHVTAEANTGDFSSFLTKMLEMQTAFNSRSGGSRTITSKTIYQKWPMKAVVFFILIILGLYPFISIYQHMPLLTEVRYWVLLVLSAPFVFKVYDQNYRRK
jgi:hypothetical protein